MRERLTESLSPVGQVREEGKIDFAPTVEVLYSLRETNASKWRPYPELTRPVFP